MGNCVSPPAPPSIPPEHPFLLGLAASRFPTPPDFWEKSSVSVPSGIATTRLARATRTDSQGLPRRAALARGAFFGKRISGGRSLGSYVPRLRVRGWQSWLRRSRPDAHLWAQFRTRRELLEALPPETKQCASRTLVSPAKDAGRSKARGAGTVHGGFS